ncbi:MAG: DUF4209 domain-containing protein [Propionicimonas sp.]
MSIAEVASLLDQAASESPSWRVLWVRLHQHLGLGVAEDRGISEDSPASIALDAVEYILAFDASRVSLLPRGEVDDEAWPKAVANVPRPTVAQWKAFAGEVRDHSVLARFRHLLFQAKAGSGRDLAVGAAAEYLLAASEERRHIDQADFAHAALRLSLAVGNTPTAELAAEKMRALAMGCLADGAPGIAARLIVSLAGVGSLPFDFEAAAEEVLANGLEGRNADRVYDAWIRRVPPECREPLWRRRVQAAIEEAEATDGLARVSKLYEALRLAESSGIGALRRDVAARLQRAGRADFDMMHISTTTREYEDAIVEAADEIIRGDSLGAGLIAWASNGPPTGDTERSREVMRASLEGMVFWHLMPTQLLGPDNLPIYSGTTEADRFDVEVVKYQSIVLDHYLPILTTALRRLGEAYGVPDEASLMGFFMTWPGLDRTSARMAANALVRFWAGDFDGAVYTLLPQIESTARNLLLAADEGIYRRQREATPGQYMGLGALLEPLGRLYGLSEDWQRYYEICLRHPAGPNLRNRLCHGFAGAVAPKAATLILHLLLHLGTVVKPAQETEG